VKRRQTEDYTSTRPSRHLHNTHRTFPIVISHCAQIIRNERTINQLRMLPPCKRLRRSIPQMGRRDAGSERRRMDGLNELDGVSVVQTYCRRCAPVVSSRRVQQSTGKTFSVEARVARRSGVGMWSSLVVAVGSRKSQIIAIGPGLVLYSMGTSGKRAGGEDGLYSEGRM
jgi:hypothetical protein